MSDNALENANNDVNLVLVTGASGFIATHVIKQLVEKGYRVRGTVRSLKNEKKVAPLRELADNRLELFEADLTKDEGWQQALDGCSHVIHTASPFPLEVPAHEDELVRPALEGTRRVFEACVNAGSVKRVVLTSSVVAIFGDSLKDGHVYTEQDWPDDQKLFPYAKSKYLAEKFAWQFVRERREKNLDCFELAVINPGFVMGPLLHNTECTSIEAIRSIVTRKAPLLPDIHFVPCDVRDVAKSHVNAMLVKEAANNRHIIASTREMLSFKQLALILGSEYDCNVPTTQAPSFLLKFAGLFNKTLAQISSSLGKISTFDNSRFVKELGIDPIDIRTTVIDMTDCLMEKKMIPRFNKRKSSSK